MGRAVKITQEGQQDMRQDVHVVFQNITVWFILQKLIFWSKINGTGDRNNGDWVTIKYLLPQLSVNLNIKNKHEYQEYSTLPLFDLTKRRYSSWKSEYQV